MRPNLWEIELRQREAARKTAEEEAAAKANGPVERTCASCGVFDASFGFGCFRKRSDGMWSCADRECRAIVAARVALPPMPADPPASRDQDLFSRSAA
ncbi:hypothetical protein [Methylobacterium sp. P5_C11]